MEGSLAEQTELRHMNISETRHSPTSRHLLSLGALSQLRVLYIRVGDGHSSVFGFKYSHFRSMVSRLTDLRRLALDYSEGNLTIACLLALAECCPLLESCLIPHMEIRMLDFQSHQVPLFPKWKELCVKSFVPERNVTTNFEKGASVLAFHFPDIMLFEYRKLYARPPNRVFTEEVEAVWRKHRNEENRLNFIGARNHGVSDLQVSSR
ncbi:uncharacterized protein BDV17DRAFT_214892 [Aspergillus undulatus]|uniref:uncharacterized protein n=1 Tax=Aspergillus undulatus TaxID=1810928 RepID=UPI003CCCB27A